MSTPIAICLTTYDPDPHLLRRQIASLQAQTRGDFTCIVQDDASAPDRYAEVERACAADSRFILFRNSTNLGFYRNFELALSRLPRTVGYVALCDQDDYWYPNKLAVNIARLEANPTLQLVYSDMHLVDGDGHRIADTFWTGRRNNHTNLDTILLANTVCGAAACFRGSLLAKVLPFPPTTGPTFHDQWIAAVAMMAGGMDYIDAPLLQYTQHANNVLGHTSFESIRAVDWLPKLLAVNWRQKLSEWQHLYETDYRRLLVMTRTLGARFPDADRAERRILSLFDGSLFSALRLLTGTHAAVRARGDTTGNAELWLAVSLLTDRFIGTAKAR